MSNRPASIPRIFLPRSSQPLAQAPSLTGTVGEWEDVTPEDMVLDSGGDNFGANGEVLQDPTLPHVLYTFADFQGCWRSTDYGRTWTKRSEADSVIEEGKAWGTAIAPDGSYMLVAGTYRKVLASTDGGVTWAERSSSISWDPYGFDIDPDDADHVIASSHEDDHLWESFDGGATWSDRGSTGGSISQYVRFGLTADTVLCISDGDAGAGNGTRRATWNGSAWSSFTAVSTQQHWHGCHQMYVDRANGLIFNPGAFGIDKSDDDGATWSQVTATTSGMVLKANGTLYAARGYASQSVFSPQIQHATAPAGTSWSNDSAPGGMLNGPDGGAVTTDASGYALVVACWCAGIWRLRVA